MIRQRRRCSVPCQTSQATHERDFDAPLRCERRERPIRPPAIGSSNRSASDWCGHPNTFRRFSGSTGRIAKSLSDARQMVSAGRETRQRSLDEGHWCSRGSNGQSWSVRDRLRELTDASRSIAPRAERDPSPRHTGPTPRARRPGSRCGSTPFRLRRRRDGALFAACHMRERGHGRSPMPTASRFVPGFVPAPS